MMEKMKLLLVMMNLIQMNYVGFGPEGALRSGSLSTTHTQSGAVHRAFVCPLFTLSPLFTRFIRFSNC